MAEASQLETCWQMPPEPSRQTRKRVGRRRDFHAWRHPLGRQAAKGFSPGNAQGPDEGLSRWLQRAAHGRLDLQFPPKRKWTGCSTPGKSSDALHEAVFNMDCPRPTLGVPFRNNQSTHSRQSDRNPEGSAAFLGQLTAKRFGQAVPDPTVEREVPNPFSKYCRDLQRRQASSAMWVTPALQSCAVSTDSSDRGIPLHPERDFTLARTAARQWPGSHRTPAAPTPASPCNVSTGSAPWLTSRSGAASRPPLHEQPICDAPSVQVQIEHAPSEGLLPPAKLRTGRE